MPLARIALRVGVVPMVIVAVLLVFARPDPAAAQRAYRLEGRVQWVAGGTLSLAVNDGPAVSIDLRNVPQDDYAGLAQGDWVVVIAELSADRRRLIGTSVARVPEFQAP